MFHNLLHRLAQLIIGLIHRGDNVAYKAPSNSTIRYTVNGFKSTGFYRVRKRKSRGYRFQYGDTFTQLHLGRITIAWETGTIRHTWNFSGGVL